MTAHYRNLELLAIVTNTDFLRLFLAPGGVTNTTAADRNGHISSGHGKAQQKEHRKRNSIYEIKND